MFRLFAKIHVRHGFQRCHGRDQVGQACRQDLVISGAAGSWATVSKKHPNPLAMITAEYIVILKSGHKFRMYPDAVEKLKERMAVKHPTPWQTVHGDDGGVDCILDLQEVEAIVKEKYLIK